VRILLIEDDSMNADFFLAVLEHDGHLVAHESSSVLGQARAQAEPFDLVLCDISMPDRDGLTVCRELRAAGFRGKIVALTVHAEDADRASAREAGFDGFLAKPITPPVLRAAVHGYQP